MSSQRRVSGTAVQRTIAVLGSAVFFVVAPCTLAGLVPWSITGWQLQPPFLGLELTRAIGAHESDSPPPRKDPSFLHPEGVSQC